jgi:hypothetical protein
MSARFILEYPNFSIIVPSLTAPAEPRRRLRRPTLAELGLLALATPVVASVRIALWVLPSAVIVRGVRRLSSRELASPSRREAHDIAWAVAASSRLIPRASCLTQAIAGVLVLHWHGYDSQLCIGAGRDPGGRFHAHAWLERRGVVLLGGGVLRELTRFPDLASTTRTSAAPSP